MNRVELRADDWMNYPPMTREVYARMTDEGIIVASLDQSGRVNLMTIGWGLFGSIWGRPIFAVLIRPSRYTYGCIEHTGDFSVNVFPSAMKDVADYCGSTSGSTVYKMAEKDLSPFVSKAISSPGILQANIIYECQVVHRNDVQKPELLEEITGNYYPDGDFHRIYFGQIMGVSVEKKYFDSIR